MKTRSPVTCHVLDTANGRPASGIPVRLEKSKIGKSAEPEDLDQSWERVAEAVTDTDGRCAQLIPQSDWTQFQSGLYRCTFKLSTYYKQHFQPVSEFYPFAQIVFRVHNPDEHFHIPLLLSPFGYTTYRGS